MVASPRTIIPYRERMIDREQRSREEALERQERLDALAPVPLSTGSIDLPAPLLFDRLDPTEATILYGPGGVGKGSLATAWCRDLTLAGRGVLIVDFEGHRDEWSRRLYGLAGPEILNDVGYIAPLAEGFSSLLDIAAVVKRWTVASALGGMDVDYLIVDSAVMAAGDDPLAPETAMRYSAALQTIGVASLTLAHVTKMHDARYPFGSVFWHNLARVTWSMMPKANDILLVCQKANNYLRPSAQTVDITWRDGYLREVGTRSATVSLLDRILEVLEGGPLSPAAIVAEMNAGYQTSEHVKSNTVSHTLTRGLAKDGANFPFTVRKGLWAVRDRDNP